MGDTETFAVEGLVREKLRQLKRESEPSDPEFKQCIQQMNARSDGAFADARELEKCLRAWGGFPSSLEGKVFHQLWDRIIADVKDSNIVENVAFIPNERLQKSIETFKASPSNTTFVDIRILLFWSVGCRIVLSKEPSPFPLTIEHENPSSSTVVEAPCQDQSTDDELQLYDDENSGEGDTIEREKSSSSTVEAPCEDQSIVLSKEPSPFPLTIEHKNPSSSTVVEAPCQDQSTDDELQLYDDENSGEGDTIEREKPFSSTVEAPCEDQSTDNKSQLLVDENVGEDDTV